MNMRQDGEHIEQEFNCFSFGKSLTIFESIAERFGDCFALCILLHQKESLLLFKVGAEFRDLGMINLVQYLSFTLK